jgi:hypothetical protein
MGEPTVASLRILETACLVHWLIRNKACKSLEYNGILCRVIGPTILFEGDFPSELVHVGIALGEVGVATRIQ